MGQEENPVVCAFVFGIFTLATSRITSLQELALFRFLSGVGLGGTVPNALAFGSEYAPSRLKNTMTTVMWAGVAFGSVVAGIAAAYLLPVYGWQSLYALGGILPMIISVVLVFCLPDTLDFLVRRGKDKRRVLRIVSRIAPALAKNESVEYYSVEKKLQGVPVKHLFFEGRAFTTVMLWLGFLGSFYMIWFLLAWSPTLLKKAGASVKQFSIVFALLNLGSAVATIAMGRLMDKGSPYNLLKGTYFLAFVSIVVFGRYLRVPSWSSPSPPRCWASLCSAPTRG